MISFCRVSCAGEEEMEGKKTSVAGGLLSILTEQKINKEVLGIQVRLPRRTLEELPRNAGLNQNGQSSVEFERCQGCERHQEWVLEVRQHQRISQEMVLSETSSLVDEEVEKVKVPSAFLPCSAGKAGSQANSSTEAESRGENAPHCQGEERQGLFKVSGCLQIHGML